VRRPIFSSVGWLVRIKRPGEKHGSVTYYKRQPAHQSDKRLRRALQTLRLWRDPSAPGGAITFALRRFITCRARRSRGANRIFTSLVSLHPHLPFEYFLELISSPSSPPARASQSLYDGGVHYFGRVSPSSLSKKHAKNEAAGVDSCPGGGAKFSTRGCAASSATHKVSGQMWLTTRAQNSRRRACVERNPMLPGPRGNRRRARGPSRQAAELQDVTAALSRSFRSRFTRQHALSHIPKTTGYLDRRNIAVSRLLLDNSSTSRLTGSASRRASRKLLCSFGANDLDGTVVEEKIYHDAGAKTFGVHRRATNSSAPSRRSRTPVDATRSQ